MLEVFGIPFLGCILWWALGRRWYLKLEEDGLEYRTMLGPVRRYSYDEIEKVLEKKDKLNSMEDREIRVVRIRFRDGQTLKFRSTTIEKGTFAEVVSRITAGWQRSRSI